MKKILFALTICLFPLAAHAQAVTQPFTVTITITPVAAGVALSSTTLNTVGPNNANAVVGAVTVTTNPPGGNYTGTLTLSGTNASSFVLTNSGKLPCNLAVGATNIAAGSYAVSITAN